MVLSEAQKEAIAALQQQWDNVGEPCPLPCEDCVTVVVSSDQTGTTMVIGIEADGHCHS